MELLVDIATLHSAYRRGVTSPLEQVERCLAQRQDPDWAVVWIAQVSAERLRQQAQELEDRWRAARQHIDRLPLYGVLFAVKDNIDVAGMPTTAGCPAFAYTPAHSAPVVMRLEAAGAILVGKTNLDQFATGLVGTRSPYGAVPNAFKPEYISGGSSAGSAVAVARGLVSFTLGTDTAGSGRVPAGLEQHCGPQTQPRLAQRARCGAGLSVTGLRVDLCAHCARRGSGVAGRHAALTVETRTRGGWTWRQISAQRLSALAFRMPTTWNSSAIPMPRTGFEQSIALLRSLGGEAVEIDFAPFLEAAALLYEGPWVAERLAALREFFETQADAMHEVVRTIIGEGARYSAADLFDGLTRSRC